MFFADLADFLHLKSAKLSIELIVTDLGKPGRGVPADINDQRSFAYFCYFLLFCCSVYLIRVEYLLPVIVFLMKAML